VAKDIYPAGEEWNVKHVNSKAAVAKVIEDEVAKGDMMISLPAGMNSSRYVTFAEGAGDLGDFRKVVSNDFLGLEEEYLEADVKKALEGMKTSH